MESSSSGVTIEVDGAKLLVCERCRRFGVEVKKKPSKHILPPVKTITNAPQKPQKITRPRLVHAKTLTTQVSEYELAENYPQRIRTARESAKLTQGEFAQKIGERLSIVQKLETGKIRPSDTLVERIDRLLRINLRTPVEEDLTSHHYPKPNTDLTIGDIARPMVKKKDDEEQQ
jgi:putative transcription factor